MRYLYIIRYVSGDVFVGDTREIHTPFCISVVPGSSISAIYDANTVNKFLEYDKYVSAIVDGRWDQKYRILKNFTQMVLSICEDNITAFADYARLSCCKHSIHFIRTRLGDENIDPNTDVSGVNIPLCKCGLPCDICKNEEENFLQFRCVRLTPFECVCGSPCDFEEEYTKDRNFRLIVCVLPYLTRVKPTEKKCFSFFWWLYMKQWSVDIYTSSHGSTTQFCNACNWIISGCLLQYSCK